MTFQVYITGSVTVEADTLAEAEERANNLTPDDIADVTLAVDDIMLVEAAEADRLAI